jgi:hypothetical protein
VYLAGSLGAPGGNRRVGLHQEIDQHLESGHRLGGAPAQLSISGAITTYRFGSSPSL